MSGDKHVSVYRFFDVAGALLYVGITGRSVRRFYEHNAEKPWWGDVNSVTVEHYGTRTEALEVEARAIREESPKHNIAGARRSGPAPSVTRADKANVRLAECWSMPLSPDSMLGSFFHSFKEDGHTDWQGCVVGEPAPAVYLVQLFSWWDGEPTKQRLVRIEDMAGWSFYDSAKRMMEEYEEAARPNDDRVRAARQEAVA